VNLTPASDKGSQHNPTIAREQIESGLAKPTFIFALWVGCQMGGTPPQHSNGPGGVSHSAQRFATSGNPVCTAHGALFRDLLCRQQIN